MPDVVAPFLPAMMAACDLGFRYHLRLEGTDVKVENYFATLERARALGLELPEGEPAAERKLAALVVLARVLSRETWQEERLLLEDDLRKLPRRVPPPATGGGFRSWIKAFDPSGKAVLEHVTDKLAHHRFVLVPSELTTQKDYFGIGTAISEIAAETPVDTLECKDLRTIGVSTAYRGAKSGARERPTFHGYDFGDTPEQGKKTLESLFQGRGRTLEAGARAFAWPLCKLDWAGGASALLLADPDGVLRVITPKDLAEREEERPG